MYTKKELSGKFARWILSLQEYDFEVRHLKGNVMADALSRNLDGELPECETDHVICVLQSNKPSGYAPHKLAFLQQVDSQLRKICFDLSYPKPGRKPHEFVVHKKVLYKKNFGPGRKFLLVVPSVLRRKILKSCHDDPHAGHMGREKTFARVSERYWWPKMFASVKKYVSCCMYCQLHKHAVGQTVGRLQPIPPPAHAFEMLGIDHLGPLQTTDSGNKHVIVAIDYLTKWVEVAAVPDTSTDHVIPFIQDNIIHRHSHPKRLVSDQGPAFSSKEFDARITEWRIDHIPATPEHPQTNGLVERLNRTATLAIAAYLNTSHTDWDVKLQGAALAVNTARQLTTEITPFEMVYGRRPVMAQENKFPWPPERPEPYAVFAQRVADLREGARLRIVEKQRKVKEDVDRSRRVTQELRVGELVLVKRNLIKKGKTKKFLPKFVGPYQVVKKVCETTYLVEDLPARRKKTMFRRFNAHVCQIRRFHARDDVEWEQGDYPDKEEEGSSDSEEEGEVINNTREPREPEENLPSVAATETVGEEQQPVQPREPERTRAGRQTRAPRWHNDYERH
jgi:hypothetical protein